MEKTFEQLGLNELLTTGVAKAGITVPTAIQQAVIPVILQGKDVIGQSATGTGKTLAYLLPLFQKIDAGQRGTQVVILAPTHELAMQIHRQAELLAAHAAIAISSLPVIGNVNIARQIEKLKEKPHIIVGSGGRILELIQKRKINSQTVKAVVLDEADRLLDDQNIDTVKAIIKTMLRDRQLLLFSATVTPAALNRARDFIPQPQVITIAADKGNAPDIAHQYFFVEQRDKAELLRKLVKGLNIGRALVFVNKSDDIEMMAAKLNYHGLKAADIHGVAIKADRKKALEDFRSGKVQLLVASDVAARGLDIADIDYVINVDMPEDAQAYLHRAGRTGRAGQSGVALSLIAPRERSLVAKFEKILNVKMTAKKLVRGQVVDIEK